MQDDSFIHELFCIDIQVVRYTSHIWSSVCNQMNHGATLEVFLWSSMVSVTLASVVVGLIKSPGVLAVHPWECDGWPAEL